MLDDHQRVLALEAHEQFGSALGLVVGHAGDGFVQQQQLRVLHQQHADFQPLFLAVGEQPGGPVGLVGKADLPEGVGDLVQVVEMCIRDSSSPWE